MQAQGQAPMVSRKLEPLRPFVAKQQQTDKKEKALEVFPQSLHTGSISKATRIIISYLNVRSQRFDNFFPTFRLHDIEQ